MIGNSGSGKSSYAKHLANLHGLAHLDLDAIVWEPGKIAVPRPDEAVRADLATFIAAHRDWVIEGCYGELIEAALPAAGELVFLNPGVEVCLAHNRQRPWEPHKYASKAEQDAMLEPLLDWVRGYYQREDAWSYAAHRRLFDGHEGPKRELLTPIALD